MSAVAADWDLQPFDPGSTEAVEQECAVRFEEFIEQNNQQLRELEEALEPTLSEAHNPLSDPLGLDLAPYEASSLIELVKTDNKLFDKLMLVFASLVLEMKKLARLARSRYSTPFLLFGMEHPPSDDGSSSSSAASSSSSSAPSSSEFSAEGDSQLQIGRMLGFVVEFSAYLNRCYVVTRNVIRQLASLYHQEQTMYKQSFHNFHLDSVWSALGELFVALMLLDEVVRSNETFAQCWAMYKRMTQAIRADASRYQVQEDDVLKFEKLFGQLEGNIFEGLIFFNAVNQEFDFPGIVSVRKNAVFRNEFLNHIKNEIMVLTSPRVPSPEARVLMSLSQRYMSLCGLFACYFAIFKAATDKKLFQSIWDLYKLFPVVHLTADCVWVSTDFLSKKVLLAQHLPTEDISGFRNEFLKRWQSRFPAEVQALTMESNVWMVQIESNLSNRAELLQIIDARRALLTEGVRLAQKINELFNLYVVLHTKLRRAIRPSDVPLLWKLVELLKGIQLTYARKSSTIAETIAFMTLRLTFSLQANFLPLKKRLSTLDQKQLSPARLDALAAVGCALSMLNSGAAENRRAVLSLCSHIIYPVSGWKEVEIDEVKQLIDRLSFVASFQDILQRVCNTSFLFWNYSNFLGFYWTGLKMRPSEALKLPYVLAAFRDIDSMLAGALHEAPERMRKDFQDEIRQELRTQIIDHLQRTIETDLRFHVHCHLGVENRDPFKNGVLNLRPFLDLQPLPLFDGYLSLREEITRYLDKTFYNLNTLQLSDWKTYGEMRNLAREKYGLELTDVHLPGQTLEQGLDVLEIMRGIHVFVARFAYNINNQVFIERASDSKFLNSINIQHIANSIRTHGTGIMNTAVNLIFQFLKRKFNIFSQFLFDDYIKSHLYRDVKFFKDNRTQLENMYSYDRAELFNKEIRKLGMSAKNESYMDQFRSLITEIGNAMGYVRMIRSAGMLYTGNAIKFVPDLQTIPKFAQLATDAALPPTTLEAATNLDSTLETLSKNFAEGIDYFKHLVSVFSRQFRDPKNLHLHSFYAIIPPLTINFVEHSLLMKEKLAKKKAYSGGVQDGSGFTDDGFAIGLAYILKLLDQNGPFNSLHWFDSVYSRYQKELEKVETATKRALEDERIKSKGRRSTSDSRESEVSQSLVLTSKKLNTTLMEFQLLRYSFEGARIFFKE